MVLRPKVLKHRISAGRPHAHQTTGKRELDSAGVAERCWGSLTHCPPRRSWPSTLRSGQGVLCGIERLEPCDSVTALPRLSPGDRRAGSLIPASPMGLEHRGHGWVRVAGVCWGGRLGVLAQSVDGP